MPERYERLLRIICLVLGGVLFLRVGWVVIHHNPLAHLKIPAVPTLAAKDTASAGKSTNNAAGSNTTQQSASKSSPHQSTNSTNSLSSRESTGSKTNVT